MLPGPLRTLQDPLPGRPGSASRLKRLRRRLGVAGFAAFASASLLVASARWFWLGELAASFAWHLGLAGGAGAVCLWLVSCRRLALVTLALAGLHAGPELALYLPDASSGQTDGDGTRPGLVVASVNLAADNGEHAAFARWLAEHRPDVVACYEVTPAWLAVLDGLAGEYPHRIVSPERGAWTETMRADAILSRLPFAAQRLVPVPGWRAIPEVVVGLGGRAVTLRAAHTMRAGRAWRLALRDEALEVLGRLPWDDAGILLGDLNATSTSPAFRRLVEASGLRDSRRGFGRQPTFAVRRVPGAPRIAIDHVLVGEALRVLARETVPLPGSDHRGVIARLALVPER